MDFRSVFTIRHESHSGNDADATVVLDEILDNETELPLFQHATDTAGYTEIIFALFDLLGYQFAPRLRDLGDQQLYRLDGASTPHHVRGLLKGKLQAARFLDQWDALLRLAGSLKLGWVTASLLIGKLHAMPKQNALVRSLQEYGRLVKRTSSCDISAAKSTVARSVSSSIKAKPYMPYAGICLWPMKDSFANAIKKINSIRRHASTL